jgi:hypothetical protein
LPRSCSADASALRGSVWLAFWTAALILAHNLTSVTLAGILLLAVPLVYARASTARSFFAAAGGVVVAVGLSAFFWYPSLALTPEVRPALLTQGGLNYAASFGNLSSIFGWTEFYSVGPLAILYLVAGLWAAWAWPAGSSRRFLFGCLAAAVVFLALVFPVSDRVWKAVPVLPFFQFPWRFLGPAGVMLTVGLGAALLATARRSVHLTAFFAAAAMGLVPMIASGSRLASRAARRSRP